MKITYLAQGMYLRFAIIFSLCVSGINSFAQGFTVKWSGGYGWSGKFNSENIPVLNTDFRSPSVDALVNLSNSSDVTGSNRVVHTSYGQGMNFSFRLGYMINRYVGVDVGVCYTQSSTVTGSQIHTLYYPDSLGTPAASGTYINSKFTGTARSVLLTPSVTVAFDKPTFKAYPYFRAGISLPVWTQVVQTMAIDLNYTSAPPPVSQDPYFLGNHTDVGMTTYGGFSVGFNASLGAVYKPLPYLGLFAEINAQYLQVKGKRAQITEWTADDQDALPYRGVYRNQFNYVSKLTSSSNNAQYNNNYDSNSPKDDKKPVLPFAYIGLNIGVQLTLNKNIFTDGLPPVKKQHIKKAKSNTKNSQTGTHAVEEVPGN